MPLSDPVHHHSASPSSAASIPFAGQCWQMGTDGRQTSEVRVGPWARPEPDETGRLHARNLAFDCIDAAVVMLCFPDQTVPVIELANGEITNHDQWHCSRRLKVKLV